MSMIVEGIVRGGKIVLVDGTELTDGQRVQVVIKPQPGPDEPVAGEPTPEEGTVHTPLDDPALIKLLDRIRRDRLPLPPSPSGPGRKSTAGTLADDMKWDKHMHEILESRKLAADREFLE